MVRKVFKSGNSLVISLPKDSVEALGLYEGSEISVQIDREEGRLIIEPVSGKLANVDADFAKQLDDFIEQYRPALEKLAQ